MEERKIGKCGIAAAFLALALIFCLSVLNLARNGEPLRRWLSGETGFSGMAKEVAAAYTSDDFQPKDACVTLNGLFARLTGRRVYNSVVRLNNGMLTVKNMTGKMPLAEARKTAAFADFLQQLEIPFLCAAAPYKVPLEGEMLPAGAEDISNEQRDVFLEKLREQGVSTLDLRMLYSATPEQAERNFYRTDHHWTPDTALQAFGVIMEKLEEMLGTPLDRQYADSSQWERHELADWWLGSNGKRVGPLYAGTDPLIWFTPKFETNQSYAFARTNREFGFRKGTYGEICLYPEEYTARRDFYGMDGEGICMDKLYPLVVHRNLRAPNPQRILLIGDSFSRAVQTYLAEEFAEVHLLDPRYYTASSLAQYADWTRPDAVLVLSQTLSSTFFVNSGAADQAAWREAHPRQETVLEGNFPAGEVPAAPEGGRVYHLSFDSVSFSGGDAETVSAVLADRASGEVVWAGVFDAEFGNAKNEFRWSFSVPRDQDCRLLLVPGLPGENRTGSAEFSGVTLTRDAE